MTPVMQTALTVVAVMAGVGLFFGFVLAIVNKKFAVEQNPLIHIVDEVLPKGQCGACGFPGCMAYAEAVVTNPDVPPNLCIPGKAAVAKAVAELTGKVAEEVAARVAHVRCKGDKEKAVFDYEYEGIKDCGAAAILHGGPKGCQYGCMGFGTCVAACPFDAISMGANNLPVVDDDKCTGCGKCEIACPKDVIQMLTVGSHVVVNCNSKDKGAVARKLCTVACIGCGICKKNCPYDAITMVNNLSVVNSDICMTQCSENTCVPKCPTTAIKDRIWA
jgi:Na+-translocating ferredoxin:NAD+ oxidoreductase subunit B